MAVRHRPFAGDEVRVVRRHDALVRGHDHALRRVVALRQRLERDKAGPVIAGIPARRGRQALQVVVGAAQRHPARREEADIAVDIGVDDVLLRRVEVAQRGGEAGPVARLVHPHAGLEGAVVRTQRGPLERDHVLRAKRPGRGGQWLGHVRDHRPVARAADFQRHVGRALDADGLGAGLEAGPAVRGLVLGLAAGPQPFDKQVLHVRRGIGQTPCDAVVVPEHHHRNAGQRGAGHVESRGGHAGEIPQRRRLQTQVRVVGQHRLARLRMRTGDHPVVRAHALDIARRRLVADAGHGIRQRRQLLVQVAVIHGAHRLLARVRRQQFTDARHRQHLRQSHAQRLLVPVAAQVPRHHGLPAQRIGRLPVLRLGAQQQELGWQRSLPMVDPRIDAVCVCLQGGPRLRRGLRKDRFGVAPHAQRAQELVGIERGGAQDLGEPAGHHALVHLHLPQPVLRVDIAQREPCVGLAGGTDLRHAVAIAHDGDPAVQARERNGARCRRLRRLPIPDQGPCRAGYRQHQQPSHKLGQTTEPAHRCSPLIFIVMLSR
ncbi:hypothetical protein D9M70_377670 [compost metagenome]